ncbi:hypothetical protein [Brevundimonas variabilis]|uniref:Lipoprotein n=1 Tax=Brevundimonas variabilis TaxID=74312 RepID=A0A7W9FFH2_9CAUL|nr:hypothetical protein [Brevundimonas variabilis]MBB5747432.1 hypothetical protein [Brevundimonas variabilis]
MFKRSILAVAALASTLAACATAPSGSPYPVAPAAFNTADFAWSQQSGRAAIDGRIAFNLRGETYNCTGSVVLTPDTHYTRQRFNTLYGSVNRAAIPEPIVRARNVPDPNADYRTFVRQERCTDNQFRIADLPNGSWFLIATVSAGAERIVLMRRVETRGGRTLAVTL